MTPRILALAILPLVCLGAAEEGAQKTARKQLPDVEQKLLLQAFDADKDGRISDAERDAAIAAHGETVRKHVRDPERTKQLEGEHGKKQLLRMIAGHLANNAWLKAIGDAPQRESNSESDILEVQATRSLPMGDGFRAYVKVRWGDLDNRIEGGGKQYYSNWAGQLTLSDGVAVVAKKLAFDDSRGAEPKEGSGSDKLDNAGSGKVVSWRAATVGFTDGLIIQLDLPAATGGGVVEAGGKTIRFSIAPASDGTELPDGRKVNVGKLQF